MSDFAGSTVRAVLLWLLERLTTLATLVEPLIGWSPGDEIPETPEDPSQRSASGHTISSYRERV
jgi:hypothetical protein